jgi:hypothetical protein
VRDVPDDASSLPHWSDEELRQCAHDLLRNLARLCDLLEMQNQQILEMLTLLAQEAPSEESLPTHDLSGKPIVVR